MAKKIVTLVILLIIISLPGTRVSIAGVERQLGKIGSTKLADGRMRFIRADRLRGNVERAEPRTAPRGADAAEGIQPESTGAFEPIPAGTVDP